MVVGLVVVSPMVQKLTVSVVCGPLSGVVGVQLAGVLQLPLVTFHLYEAARVACVKTNVAATSNATTAIGDFLIRFVLQVGFI